MRSKPNHWFAHTQYSETEHYVLLGSLSCDASPETAWLSRSVHGCSLWHVKQTPTIGSFTRSIQRQSAMFSLAHCHAMQTQKLHRFARRQHPLLVAAVAIRHDNDIIEQQQQQQQDYLGVTTLSKCYVSDTSESSQDVQVCSDAHANNTSNSAIMVS